MQISSKTRFYADSEEISIENQSTVDTALKLNHTHGSTTVYT